MLHQITMSQTASGDLNLIWLINGAPFAFRQTSNGVWQPSVAIPAQTTFKGIRGLNNGNGLVALDLNDKLWFTTQTGSVWASGFTLLPNLNHLQFSDFDVCEVNLPGASLLIAATEGAGYLYTQTGNTLASMSQPTQVTVNNPLSSLSTWDWGHSVAAVASPGNGTPTAVLFGYAGDTGALFASSTDGINWDFDGASSVPLPSNGMNQVAAAIAPGNPNGTLQAIVLNSRDWNLYLWFDASGAGTNWDPFLSPLPNPDGLSFSNVAASIGGRW